MREPVKVNYPSEPLRCWAKAKELREKYYRDYAQAHEKGGLRWSGGAEGIEVIPAGLGRDVYPMTGEPYGASVAFDRSFARRCHEAVEAKGYARDLCAYMRNYWGSILLDEYLFGGPFPKPDFFWQHHFCCSHGKWYQEAARLEGGQPYFCVDIAAGPCFKKVNEHYVYEPQPHQVQYLVDQMQEAIAWLERVTGRPYNDELMIEAAYNYFDTTSLWAEICILNQAVPAPLDEKSMFALYVFGALNKASKEFADFYRELRDEVKDRIHRGVAALPTERARVMTDIQPPWGFLKIFRYLERYGCVSIGSLYTFALMAIWQIESDGRLRQRITPQEKGIRITDREHCLQLVADWVLSFFWLQNSFDHKLKSYLMKAMFHQWHCDGILIHYNRGCEGLSMGVAENRLDLVTEGIPVMAYEGNMGDDREFDEVATRDRIDAFMETLGLK